MKLQLNKLEFPIELIVDGSLLEKEMKENGLTKEWLGNELRKKGRKYLTFSTRSEGQRKLIFDFYEDGIHKPTDEE